MKYIWFAIGILLAGFFAADAVAHFTIDNFSHRPETGVAATAFAAMSLTALILLWKNQRKAAWLYLPLSCFLLAFASSLPAPGGAAQFITAVLCTVVTTAGMIFQARSRTPSRPRFTDRDLSWFWTALGTVFVILFLADASAVDALDSDVVTAPWAYHAPAYALLSAILVGFAWKWPRAVAPAFIALSFFSMFLSLSIPGGPKGTPDLPIWQLFISLVAAFLAIYAAVEAPPKLKPEGE